MTHAQIMRIIGHTNKQGNKNMTKYEARISNAGEYGFYALVVRVDNYGEHVVNGFGSHYKTEKMAIKQATNFINKKCL